MRVSIIVPMLNEAPGLPGLLARLVELEDQGCEILIVDGGSGINALVYTNTGTGSSSGR